MFSTLLNVLNLWLAGRIVKVSGRLRRPWPDLSTLTFPPFAPGLLAAAVAGSFLPDLFGLLSGVFAASLLMAFAILGFAVLHAITRGMGSRGLAARRRLCRGHRFRLAGPRHGRFWVLPKPPSTFAAASRQKRGPPTLRT